MNALTNALTVIAPHLLFIVIDLGDGSSRVCWDQGSKVVNTEKAAGELQTYVDGVCMGDVLEVLSHHEVAL